jgi:hypothetical protein
MLTKTEDGDVYRYQLSIELRLELNPLRIFANSEIPPNVDLKRKYDFLTARIWRGGDRSILQIDEPENESVLFWNLYATSFRGEMARCTSLYPPTQWRQGFHSSCFWVSHKGHDRSPQGTACPSSRTSLASSSAYRR